jgi:hypothetical protein
LQVDYGAMLERNPGLLGSHSNNFSVYTERVTALAQWAPPTLDLNKVLSAAGTRTTARVSVLCGVCCAPTLSVSLWFCPLCSAILPRQHW